MGDLLLSLESCPALSYQRTVSTTKAQPRVLGLVGRVVICAGTRHPHRSVDANIFPEDVRSVGVFDCHWGLMGV